MLTDAKILGSSDLKKCRLCFEAENTLIYIYEVGGSLKNIARTISEVLNYEVFKDDQFPPYICVCCCGNLLEFRAFKSKCDSLRETYKLFLSSRQNATDDIEEKGQDRSLRHRKVIDYSVDQSGSEVSDPESSDSFFPSNQGDSDGISSEDFLTSDRNLRKGKRFQVSRKQVDTVASGNSGAAGLEEVTDERNGQTVCDLRAGFTVGSSAISTISSGSDGYSKGVVSGTLESSTVWVGLSHSHEQQGSLRAQPVISTSDVSHNVVSMGCQPNSSVIVSKVSCALTPKNAVQLTNNSNAGETHSVSNLVLEYQDRSAAFIKEINASHLSESITLKDLLEGQSIAPKVCNGSPLKNGTSCLENSSLSWKDLFETEVMPSTSRASGSQTSSYCASLLNASDKEVMHVLDDGGSIPSRVESNCILESRNSLESSVILRSLDITRNGQSTEMVEKQPERTTWGSMLYPGISTIDLKSFGISLETDTDDPVPEDDEGSATQVDHESVGLIGKGIIGLQSSESDVQRFGYTQLTEESSNTFLPRFVSVGSTPVQQKKLEEETVIIHKDLRSNKNRSNVLGREGREMLSTQQQEDRGEVVRNSHSNSFNSTACAETPSVRNIVNTSINSSNRPSCGIIKAYTNYNILNQSNNITQASQSTHGIPFPSSNTGDSFLRLKYMQKKEYTPMPSAISSQMSSHRMIGYTPPANLNSPISHFSVQEVPVIVGNPEAVTPLATGYIPSSPFCGVLNPTYAGILGNGNDKGLFGNNRCNSSSVCGRPAPHTSLHSLPASRLDLFLSTSRNTTAYTNLSSQQEMRGNNLTEKRLPAYLLGLTLPRTPWEISALAILLLQPGLKLKSSSASKDNLLPSTSSYVSATSNLASQAEKRGNSAEVNGEDESLDSMSSTADNGGEGGPEEDFDGERPVKEKTKECLCDVCGSMFYGALALRAHRKGVHGEKRFRCEKCPKAFVLKHHLIQHMSMHDDSRPFICKECGSCFKLKTHLRHHMLVHSKKAMFQCSHCEKGFHTKWQHDNHQPSHEGTVVWSCDGCTEKLTTWAAYMDHLLEHKKNRMFKCNMCSNVYDTKKSLRSHVMNHIKPLECSVCGKHFGLSKALKSHMRVHTGEKPYVCKVCGKGFSTNCGLRHHIKTHSDARPFKCRFCAHRTKFKPDLRRHERNVHRSNLSQNLLPSNSR